jgi:hypothetical protein
MATIHEEFDVDLPAAQVYTVVDGPATTTPPRRCHWTATGAASSGSPTCCRMRWRRLSHRWRSGVPKRCGRR